MGGASDHLTDDTLRTLLDIAPDAIAIIAAGVVRYMSPTGARMLGFADPHGAIGTSIGDWLHPDDAQRAAQRMAEVVRTGHPHDLPQEYRARTQDGRDIVAEVASVPIAYQGAPAVLAFVRDVTERKALERQVTETSRLASLGRLSAGVAHELNNPLTHLVLAVDRLRRTLSTAGPDDAAAVVADTRLKLELIAQDVERMVVIARELRLYASPQPTVRGPVDLREVIERALDAVASADPPAVIVERRYADVGPVDANPIRLVQVFSNLIRNAFDAFGGGDRGAPSSPAPALTLTLRGAGADTVAVDVSDLGPGIPLELRERVFEPFFTTKAYGAGAGLGLAISRGIVQALGGTLEVTGPQGAGTTFTVTLPRWRRPAATAGAPEIPAASRLRVLVIDDEVSIGRTLDSILEHQHEVTVTTSAREALAQIERRGEFDLILCDVVMPGGSGLDFLDQLRASHPALCERVVFMTGATLGSDQGRSLAVLPNAVVEKPFDLRRLEQLLASAADAIAADPRRALRA